jgi:hypothetical protein
LAAPPLTSLAYARFAFRGAAQFAADAVAQAGAGGNAGALISWQHAWEMAGKCALSIEAPGFAFPPSRRSGPHWMRDHRVLSNVDVSCVRLRIANPSRVRRTLSTLERWLPPSPYLASPPVNTEYLFDGRVRMGVARKLFSSWTCADSQYRDSAGSRSAARGLRGGIEGAAEDFLNHP